MTFSCQNCGSQNHLSHDCSKPYSGWRERVPAAVAPPQTKPATFSASNGQNALKSKPEAKESALAARPGGVETADRERRDELYYDEPILGSRKRLCKRRGFPFLREITRRSIDDRIALMTSAKSVFEVRQPMPEIERDYKPPALPKAAKAKKVKQKPINNKQESLF